MQLPAYGAATHISIIWGVTLAVITLLEWNALERDPVQREILSPFIERSISVTVENRTGGPEAHGEVDHQADDADAVLRYEVEFDFNGPLFLACFFGPIAVFQLIALLWRRRHAVE